MIERAFSVEINAPAQRVWDELIRTGGPIHPMFGTYLYGEFAPGKVFSHRTRNGKRTFVMGEVLESVPPRRLVHTFRFAMEQDSPTLVTWELVETGGATKLTVTHSRFEGETKTFKSVTQGWPRILALYKSLIETGTVPFGARFQNGMMSAMAFMLPARTRTELALKETTKVPGM